MPSAARRPQPTGFVAPCLPTLARFVPSGSEWAHEVKHDGYRFICRRDGDRVRMFSRSGKDWTDKVPTIVAAMRALPAASVTIDGEAVVCDAKGVSDFDALRVARARRQAPEAFLYTFDVLAIDCKDLRAEPWAPRRGGPSTRHA